MIKKNIQIVKREVEEICNSCGRNSNRITLIAVSKTNPISAIEEAFSAGINNFGENKAQEFRDKSRIVEKDISWHFVGHLQTNKVKYVIDSAEYIHSVDSIKLATEINTRALLINKIQKILIEMNTSEESSKFGIHDFDNLYKLVEECSIFKNLEVKGLMTMAPYTADENIIRKSFSRLRDLKEKLNTQWNNITELSMGMTNDYKIALEEGSTMLRIGTAIFEERDSSKSWREK